MYRSRTARAIVLVLTITLVAASCGNRNSSDSNAGGGGGGGGGGDNGESAGRVDTSNCPDNATDGISGDTITLASSFPQSGLTAAFAQISKGYKAYFEKLNDEDGGVEVAGKKYKIKVVDKDDHYNAAETAQNINELAGRNGEKAFAVFNVVGTANNLAIRKSLGANCVPNVFAATGSPVWGNPQYPWTIGSTLAPYTLEVKAYAEYLMKEKPKAKVAMLIQNDDFGQAYEQGFKAAIKGTDIKVTQVKGYEGGTDDVNAQVTSLKASGADTFIDGATLLACPNALTAAKNAGWDPVTFVSGTCISKTLMGIAGENAQGAISATSIKDPVNPQFADNPDLKEYNDALKKYGAKDVDPENGIVAYGWTQGVLLVKILESLKKLDRPSLMNAMYDQKGLKGGLLLDGISVNTSATDPYLVETVQLVQYDASKKYFNDVGKLMDFEGETAKYTPKDLINS